MNELDPKQSDKTELHAQAPQKDEDDTIYFSLHNGHKMWEMDVKKRIIQVADYTLVPVLRKSGLNQTTFKLVRKKGFLYAGALNAENADKKFIKILTGKNRSELFTKKHKH